MLEKLHLKFSFLFDLISFNPPHHNLELSNLLRGLLLLPLGGQWLDERHLGLVADPHSHFVLLDEEAHMEAE